MRIIREPQITSGFLYEEPLPSPSAVTHCGEAVSVARHSLDWHTHRGFEVQYLVRGRYPWRIRNQVVKQHMGEAMVVPPGLRHRTQGLAIEECHHLWIGVHLDRLGPPGRRLAQRLIDHRRYLLGECLEIEPILRGIITQVIQPRPSQPRVVRAYLDLLVRLLDQRLDTLIHPTRLAQPYSYPIQKAIHLMQTQLDRRLSLHDIATAAGWGMTQLCTRFHKEVGTTPAQYHLRLRLDAAREALRVPDANVTRVAIEHGFSSSQHFATWFRRAFRVSPRQWQTHQLAASATLATSKRRRDIHRPPDHTT